MAPATAAISVNKISGLRHLYKSRIIFPELDKESLVIVSVY